MPRLPWCCRIPSVHQGLRAGARYRHGLRNRRHRYGRQPARQGREPGRRHADVAPQRCAVGAVSRSRRRWWKCRSIRFRPGRRIRLASPPDSFHLTSERCAAHRQAAIASVQDRSIALVSLDHRRHRTNHRRRRRTILRAFSARMGGSRWRAAGPTAASTFSMPPAARPWYVYLCPWSLARSA